MSKLGNTMAGALAACVPLISPVANAQTVAVSAMSNAEKLRRLDIMLMVTSLRCRTTVDNFQPDFEKFEARHQREFLIANRQLRAQFGSRLGPAAATKALDHISVEIANNYGGGHPWMGCHDLKGVVQDLARVKGAAPLLTVADQLLASPTIVGQP